MTPYPRLPLVLVHGFMGGSDQWSAQAALFEGRETLLLDLPGFGRRASLPPLTSIEAYASWVIAQIDDAGVDRFDLLGHSMGGMIVQEVAHQLTSARLNKLVLYATGSVGIIPGRFETIERSIERVYADGPQETARRISALWFADGREAEGYEACAGIAEQSSIEAIVAGLTAMRDWSGRERLKDISARTLVLWGDQDRTYNWQQIESLWTNIPNSRLGVIPGAGHAVHQEQPDLLNQLLMVFFEDPSRP